MATILGYSNGIDAATLSGTLTNAANLKSRYLTQKASAAAGGYLDIDLGSAKPIGVVSVIALTGSGNVTITAGAAVGGSELFNKASAVYGPDFAQGFTNVTARYWRITFAGAVTLGRVFIGKGMTVCAEWSAAIGVESKSNVAEALAGPAYFDKRPNRRTWQFSVPNMTTAEGMELLSVMRSHDVTDEFFLVWDNTDTTYRSQRDFLCRMSTLDPIAFPYLNVTSTGVSLVELL